MNPRLFLCKLEDINNLGHTNSPFILRKYGRGPLLVRERIRDKSNDKKSEGVRYFKKSHENINAIFLYGFTDWALCKMKEGKQVLT